MNSNEYEQKIKELETQLQSLGAQCLELRLVLRSVGLQCRNIGCYGPMKIAPGECRCSTCVARIVLDTPPSEYENRVQGLVDAVNSAMPSQCIEHPPGECPFWEQVKWEPIRKALQLSAYRAQVEMLKGALEFYADKLNWRSRSGKVGITPLTDGRDADMIDGHWTPGRTARTALAQLKSEEEGK